MDSTISPNNFDASLAFTREPNILARDYWKACCRDRTMPTRADLDPVAMKKFSPHVGLVEIRKQESDIAFFVRRAGMRWEEVYGPMTGKYITEFLPPHVVTSWQEIFGEVLKTHAPTRLSSRVDYDAKRWLAVEQLIAPLGTGHDIAMLFVSFVAWPNSTMPAASFTITSSQNSAAH